MKKKDVVDLIRYHMDKNEGAFRDIAYSIAAEFRSSGDLELGNYVLGLLSDQHAFVPQIADSSLEYLRKAEVSTSPLPLPLPIYDDIIGIANASSYDSDINKFLFAGAPGTGKTESAKQLARILSRDLYIVDSVSLVDSKLGQTAKNIAALFEEISRLFSSERVVILFDEIDAIAMDRIDRNDLREMGRATSAFLKGFDGLKTSAIIIATTNLQDSFDKAFLRRFDKVVNFNRYSKEDLITVADTILDEMLRKFTFAGRNTRLFHKILSLMDPIPYPGDLRNMIRSAIAFSNPADGNDYFRRLYKQIHPDFSGDISILKKEHFTVREIEILSQVSKSKAARLLKEIGYE